MINFTEIDLKNKNRIIIFILSLFLFFLNHFETKTLVSILVMIIIINQYSSLKENIGTKLINNKEKSPPLINYNNKIEGLLNEIKKYKKMSRYNYKRGMHYWYQFVKAIDLLENDDLYNYNQYFENAFYYLRISTNIFQSFGVEAEERNYIDAIKYNDLEVSKDMMNITKVVKELYKEGYLILYNLSLRLNKKWEENPHILNKEIIFNHPLPFDKTSTNNYDYY
tara:strand:- start:1648 stop:2319 length:672 start_codon:yes stop_codon:yes gene_type:complete